jgi:hypothetical protein
MLVPLPAGVNKTNLSYSQIIISSYAVSKNVYPQDPKNLNHMTRAGGLVAEAMSAVHGEKYGFGQARDILYPSSGSTKDWMLDVYGVDMAWTWELRDTGRVINLKIFVELSLTDEKFC